MAPRWYLHSSGGANLRPSDGSLSPVAATMEPVDSFNCGAPNAESLRYSSPVFIAPLVVRGRVVVELYGASSAADAEFAATLVDIAPDLTGAVIASATGRASGDATHIAIDLGELEHTFAIAHRMRLDLGATSRAGLAAQQVFHDAVRPSCVALSDG
ncbi:MAG: CocE/NonD family hydrolase C-terminal non-catalytic domain-containing protein [Acidimicrobiales bacterium]